MSRLHTEDPPAPLFTITLELRLSMALAIEHGTHIMGISSSFTRCSDGIDTALAFSICPADGLFLLLAVVPLFTVFFIVSR